MPRITFEEALMTLEGKGPVLEVAREVCAIMREAGIKGAIIGGVAVGLHGYLRTTDDVDVMTLADSAQLEKALVRHGFTFDADRKEFVKSGVPVHIVTVQQTRTAPKHFVEVDRIRTVSLSDMISMKLRSGTQNILRAQDLGDAIGLIRHHRLTTQHARLIDADVRGEFRQLVEAIKRERAE